uniref:2b protein n=1 Tax=Tobacco rattle virus TaxID=12295 RepID=A0A2H4RGL8_9VIRU|nr:2b protein [Tobacco rattle virus]
MKTSEVLVLWGGDSRYFFTDYGHMLKIDDHRNRPIVYTHDDIGVINWNELGQLTYLDFRLMPLWDFMLARKLYVNRDGDCYSWILSKFYYYGRCDISKVLTSRDKSDDPFVFRELQRLHDFASNILVTNRSSSISREALTSGFMGLTSLVDTVIGETNILCKFFSLHCVDTAKETVLEETVKAIRVLIGSIGTVKGTSATFSGLTESTRCKTLQGTDFEKSFIDLKLDVPKTPEGLTLLLATLMKPKVEDMVKPYPLIAPRLEQLVGGRLYLEDMAGTWYTPRCKAFSLTYVRDVQTDPWAEATPNHLILRLFAAKSHSYTAITAVWRSDFPSFSNSTRTTGDAYNSRLTGNKTGVFNDIVSHMRDGKIVINVGLRSALFKLIVTNTNEGITPAAARVYFKFRKEDMAFREDGRLAFTYKMDDPLHVYDADPYPTL